MTGIEEAKKFYNDCGKDMIARNFPEFEGRIAVGLVGHGSECFGFDDDISRDHDFEVGFCLWLTKEDEEKIGFKLTRAYDALKKEYGAGKSKHMSAAGASAQGVMRIGDFYRRYTGSEGAPKDFKDWLYTESAFFAEATNGEVFRDDLGEFSAIRQEILTGMPQDVRLKKIAANAVRMAQFGQYNYVRCLKHGESGAAVLALCEFVKSACDMIFLLNKRHCPYFKWCFKSMRTLPILGDMTDALEFLLTADNDDAGQKVKAEMIEDISLAVANELKKQGMADCDGGYLEPYGYSIVKKIKNAEIRNLHILIG